MLLLAIQARWVCETVEAIRDFERREDEEGTQEGTDFVCTTCPAWGVIADYSQAIPMLP